MRLYPNSGAGAMDGIGFTVRGPAASKRCPRPGCKAWGTRDGGLCVGHRVRPAKAAPAQGTGEFAAGNLEETKTLILSVSRQVVAGQLDKGVAALVSGNLKALLGLFERAEARQESGDASGLPKGARPLTPEEDAYVEANGTAPAGVQIGLFALDAPEPPPTSK